MAALVAVAGVLPAHALLVVVGGTTYDVQPLPTGESFADNSVALSDPAQTAWWGDPALAADIRDEVFAAEGNATFTRVFAHTLTGSLTAEVRTGSTAATNPNISTGLLGIPTTDTAFQGSPYVYYTGTAVSVPEIDGNALAKALFILFALGAWLHVRRARAA